jgi:hypothetical protein
MKQCSLCGDEITPPARVRISNLCLLCGELEARKVRHCVVPLHKSNYIVVSDANLLTGVNNKGGLIK